MSRSATLKSRWADPVYRAKVSDSIRRRWADPAARERMLAGQRKAAETPEGIARLARPRRVGPLLRVTKNSRTAVPGVGYGEFGPRRIPHFVAHCGRRNFSFNIRRLGREEAFRRALKKRAEYETAWSTGRTA